MGLNEYIQIGNKIREIRKSKGFTQKEVADKLNIAATSYSNYENNNREPSLETIKKIAEILDTPIYDLIGGSLLYDYFDKTIDVKSISKEVNLLEQVDLKYGKGSSKILELYTELNTKGRAKAIDNLEDLTLIDIYTEEK